MGNVWQKILILNTSKLLQVISQIKQPFQTQVRYFCFPYPEGINHNVDELLIGILSQLKLRRENITEKRSTKVRKQKTFKLTFLKSIVLFIVGYEVSDKSGAKSKWRRIRTFVYKFKYILSFCIKISVIKTFIQRNMCSHSTRVQVPFIARFKRNTLNQRLTEH